MTSDPECENIRVIRTITRNMTKACGIISLILLRFWRRTFVAKNSEEEKRSKESNVKVLKSIKRLKQA